jgi:hemoglobin
MQTKKDIETTEDIKLLVNSFYNKVKKDDLLSPIFFFRIPNEWQPHLDKMYQFWSAALLGLSGYKGTPFVPHATMPIQREHFDRWLFLFKETLQELFEGPTAEEALLRGKNMAIMFMYRINEYGLKPQQIPLV